MTAFLYYQINACQINSNDQRLGQMLMDQTIDIMLTEYAKERLQFEGMQYPPQLQQILNGLINKTDQFCKGTVEPFILSSVGGQIHQQPMMTQGQMMQHSQPQMSFGFNQQQPQSTTGWSDLNRNAGTDAPPGMKIHQPQQQNTVSTFGTTTTINTQPQQQSTPLNHKLLMGSILQTESFITPELATNYYLINPH